MKNFSKDLKIGELIKCCESLLSNLKDFEAQQQSSELNKYFNNPMDHDYINYRYQDKYHPETYLCRADSAFRPRQVFSNTHSDEA